MSILVGSKAFFNKMQDFMSSGTDYVSIVDNPVGFNFVRHIKSNNGNVFEWQRLQPQQYIDYALNKGAAMQLGKFLVPEFVQAIGFTIEHLAQLAPLTEQLDAKHQYEKIIFDAYIANGDFTLTQEQRATAYESYQNARKKAEPQSVNQ